MLYHLLHLAGFGKVKVLLKITGELTKMTKILLSITMCVYLFICLCVFTCLCLFICVTLKVIYLSFFRLSTSFDEVKVYPIPAVLYLVKNLLQVCR